MHCSLKAAILLFMIGLMFVRRVQSFGLSPTWHVTSRCFTTSRSLFTAANTDYPTIKPDWVLRFDGGSRGNPGLGGSGAAVYNYKSSEELNEVWRGYFFIGETGITNNQAEYDGLIEGLTQCKKMNIRSLCVQGDSELVLKQVQGIYKVRHMKLIPLHRKALRLLSTIPLTTFQHIPRAQNWRADELSNMAMDRRATMQAFSPEFAAFLEQHSAEGSEVETSTPEPEHVAVVAPAVVSTNSPTQPVKRRRGRPGPASALEVRTMEQQVDVQTIPIENIPIVNVAAPLPEIVPPAKRRRNARAAAGLVAVVSEEPIVPAVVVPVPMIPVAPAVEEGGSPVVKKKRGPRASSARSTVAQVLSFETPIVTPVSVVVPLPVIPVAPVPEEGSPAPKKKRAPRAASARAASIESPATPVEPTVTTSVSGAIPVIPVASVVEAGTPVGKKKRAARASSGALSVNSYSTVFEAPVAALMSVAVAEEPTAIAEPAQKKRSYKKKVIAVPAAAEPESPIESYSTISSVSTKTPVF